MEEGFAHGAHALPKHSFKDTAMNGVVKGCLGAGGCHANARDGAFGACVRSEADKLLRLGKTVEVSCSTGDHHSVNQLWPIVYITFRRRNKVDVSPKTVECNTVCHGRVCNVGAGAI